MRCRIFSVLLGCFLVPAILLSSCSAKETPPEGGSDSSAGTDSGVTTTSAETVDPVLSFLVVEEDGSAVPGADVYLVSSSLDRQIRAVTAEDGTAVPEGVDSGTWFVRVGKDGFRTAESLIDVKDGANPVDITLAAATDLPRFLLSYTYHTSEDGASLIGLAGSDDGIAFTAFPGWNAIEGEGGGVVILDGYLCVYTDFTVLRYDLNAGTWEAPQPFCVYSDAGLQNLEQDFFGALMRDVRFFKDSAEGVVAIGGDMNPRYDYANFFEESLANQLISITGWQTPLAEAGGLLLRRPENTWMTGGLVDDSVDRDASFVLLPAPDGGRYLLTTTSDGLKLLHGSALGGDFAPMDVLPGSYIYMGSIAGVTAFYDDAGGGYTLYGVRDASEKQLYTASLPSFEEPFDPEKGLVKVDMGFLDPAVVSFSDPVIWDTSNMDSEKISDTAGLQREDLTLDFGNNGYLFYPLTQEGLGVISYSSMQEGDTSTAEISSDMTLVTVCDTYTPSAFTVSGKVPAGTNVISAGIVYAWNPSGYLPGGFAFTVSDGGWQLSFPVPETLTSLAAGSLITSDRILLKGVFTGDPAKAVLTVSFRDGHHILLIDGEVVGEYDTPVDLGGVHAGYVGLIATSGSETGGSKFTYEAPKLLVQ